MLYSKLRFNPLSVDSVLPRCCVSGCRGATGRPRHHRHHLWSRSAAGRATAAPPATPPPAEFHCRHPVMGGCVARTPQPSQYVLLQVLTRVTGVHTLLQHCTRAGQTAAQCQGPALGWAGLGGRRMGGSKTTRFSVDGSTQLFLAHTKTGELLLCRYRTCVTLVLEYAELQKLVPGIRVRDVNDDQSGSVSSAFVSWSLYFHLFGGENRGREDPMFITRY